MEIEKLIASLGKVDEILSLVKSLHAKVGDLQAQLYGNPNYKEILTSNEVMDLLTISETTLIKHENARKIKYTKLGGRKYYTRKEVLSFMDRRNKRA